MTHRGRPRADIAAAPTPGSKYQTTAQVARALGVSKASLAGMIQSGKLPRPPVVGDVFTWTPADVERARTIAASSRDKDCRRARRWLGHFIDEAGVELAAFVREHHFGCAPGVATADVARLFGIEHEVFQQHIACKRVPAPRPAGALWLRVWSERDVLEAVTAMQALAARLGVDASATPDGAAT